MMSGVAAETNHHALDPPTPTQSTPAVTNANPRATESNTKVKDVESPQKGDEQDYCGETLIPQREESKVKDDNNKQKRSGAKNVSKVDAVEYDPEHEDYGQQSSNVEDPIASATAKTFTMKLLEILNRSESESENNGIGQIISWTEDGTALLVRNKEAFRTKIMPSYFKTDQFNHFEDELKSFGFAAIDTDEGLCYSHPKFSRHNRERSQQLSPSLRAAVAAPATDVASTGRGDDDLGNAKLEKKKEKEKGRGQLSNISSKDSADKKTTSSKDSTDKQNLPFPLKMWEMLNDAEACGWNETVSWMHDGNALRIVETNEWKEIRLDYFKNPLMVKSVIRNLQLYGFSSIRGEKGVYEHPLFSRDNRERCHEIENKRKKPTKISAKKPDVGKKKKKKIQGPPLSYNETGVAAADYQSPSRPKRKAKEAGRISLGLALAEERKDPSEFTDSDDSTPGQRRVVRSHPAYEDGWSSSELAENSHLNADRFGVRVAPDPRGGLFMSNGDQESRKRKEAVSSKSRIPGDGHYEEQPKKKSPMKKSSKKNRNSFGGAEKSFFPQQVFDILEKADTDSSWSKIVSWVDNGTAFEVHNPADFEEIVMPTEFTTCTLSNFALQLKWYHFQRIGNGKYRHPKFTRNSQESLHVIVRRNNAAKWSPEFSNDKGKKPRRVNHPKKRTEANMGGDNTTPKKRRQKRAWAEETIGKDNSHAVIPTKRVRRSVAAARYNEDDANRVTDLDAIDLTAGSARDFPDDPATLVPEPYELLEDPNEFYIEEEAHLYHNPPLPSRKTVGVKPTELKQIPPPPPLPSFPETGHCKWNYDEESRVLLAKFDSPSMNSVDRDFFLLMLERDDITVVSEGLLDTSKLDSKLWDRAYWSTAMADEFFHKFRRFDTTKTANDEEPRCEEVDTLYSMKMVDYMRYLCLRNKFFQENPDYQFLESEMAEDLRQYKDSLAENSNIFTNDAPEEPEMANGAMQEDGDVEIIKMIQSPAKSKSVSQHSEDSDNDKMENDMAIESNFLGEGQATERNPSIGCSGQAKEPIPPIASSEQAKELIPSNVEIPEQVKEINPSIDSTEQAKDPIAPNIESPEQAREPNAPTGISERSEELYGETPDASHSPVESNNEGLQLSNDKLDRPMPAGPDTVLEVDEDGPIFTFRDHQNRVHSVHVARSCLYMIDLDVHRYLPSVHANFMKSFGSHEVLPGGEHCMMNSITSNAQPFMGPNVYITPPAAFTHFHQDGHGTVDSGHLVITGYNEVVMLRRLTERHKKHALWLLTGDHSNETSSTPQYFDGLYSEPHGDGLGAKPSWPTLDRIDACKKMGYCPSVIILKPSQLIHINKGRLHAFRKMATSKLPENDCHSKLRTKLVAELQLTGEILCISVAWDWMFRGHTSEGINREVCTVIEATILNRKYGKVSLAIPETSVLQMARKFVPVNRKLFPRHDYCSFIESPSSVIDSKNESDDDSSKLAVCRGILPGLRYVTRQHIDAMESASSRSRLMGKGERVTVTARPNTQEDPQHFPVDPYGNSDFFCKLCSKELSNVYYHCDGCETLLSKDFNICRECHAEKKFMQKIRMHPLNEKNHSTINHTGGMKFDRASRCPCKNGPVCKHCNYCAGCSCRCHTWFTLHSRFFSKEGEKTLLQRIEDAVTTQKGSKASDETHFCKYLNDPEFAEKRFAEAAKNYEF